MGTLFLGWPLNSALKEAGQEVSAHPTSVLWSPQPPPTSGPCFSHLSLASLPSPPTDVCAVGNSSLSQANKRSLFPMASITTFPLFALPVSLLLSPLHSTGNFQTCISGLYLHSSLSSPLDISTWVSPSLPNPVCLKLTPAPLYLAVFLQGHPPFSSGVKLKS